MDTASSISTASSEASRIETCLHAPESAGTCFSKLASEFSSVSEMVACFHAFCLSPKFTAFLSRLGLQQPRFKAFHPLNVTFDKFAKACYHLEPTTSLAIVFHGTATMNIPNILRSGLDPKRRSGQAYGPGEYFSKEPGISVSYCRGGLEMLVFVVVVPNNRHKNCPPDYVVVENNDHELPLGSVSFKAVDHNVDRQSWAMRLKLQQLSKTAIEKTQEANEAMLKATIIQLLIREKIDIASEKYQKHITALNFISKREISMYVHRLLDIEVISFYFPELPEPMMAEERDIATIKSVDEAEREASEAKEELAKETIKLTFVE
jgi:hypothetical protein